jgi:hypothetical protein
MTKNCKPDSFFTRLRLMNVKMQMTYFGNTVSIWVEKFTVRAAYVHLRGGEAVIAYQYATYQRTDSRIIDWTKWRPLNI